MRISIFILMLMITNICIGQKNVTINTYYKIKPNGELAEENISFTWAMSQGLLGYYDMDLDFEKYYYIQFRNTMYDDGGYFNIVYETDPVEHRLKRRPQSELGVFAVFYDKKNGTVLGIRVVLMATRNVETYLTREGAAIYLSKN